MKYSLLATTKTKALKIAVAFLIVVCPWALADDYLPFYNSSDFTPRWIEPMSDELEDFHQIPRFMLTNQDGEKISDRNFRSKIFIANFFFTTCPGICPTIRSKLKLVQDAYQDDAQVEIISHSITPGIDTVDILKNYADENGVKSGKWHLLTGDREEIYSLAKNAYFASEDLGNIQNENDFLHTESLFLVDENKRIRGIYNGLSKSSIKYLIKDVAILKEEMNKPMNCH